MTTWIPILFALAAGQVSRTTGPPPNGQDAIPEPPNATGTLRIQIANDALTGSDDYFSNGWIISWHTRAADRWDDLMPAWLSPVIEALPLMDPAQSKKRITLALSQLIFTPRDIENPQLIVDDVPFAGALLVAVSFSAQDPDQMNSWQLVSGLVGPASLAEETQEFAHDLVRTRVPRGWPHQLEDEFILNLHAQHKRKFLRLGEPDGWGFELGGAAEAAVGNLTTQVDAAIEIRAGWRLPPGFDPDPMGRKVMTHGHLVDQVEQPFSIHVFASAAARGWARFIFLDGNTWKESHSIEKNTWTAVFGGGVTAALHRFRFTLEFGATSRPAEGMPGFDTFGGLTFAYTF